MIAHGTSGYTLSSVGGSRIRICHVIHELKPGGAERVLLDLAAVGGQTGMEISLVSLMPLSDAYFRQQLATLGVRASSLDLRSRWDVRAFRRAPATIAAHAPDIVHTHLKHADLIGGYAARALGLPHVSTLHLIESEPRIGGTAKRWAAMRMRERSASRIIAVSDAVRDWYIAMASADPDRVVRIYNGVRRPDPVSTTERGRIRRGLELDESQMVIACVSLMRPEKGHDDLLHAIAGQRERDAVYLLAGDGPRRPDLEAQALELGLGPDRVRFLGFRDDVDKLLAASDLVVQPSHEDALPTALIQALAAGLPAVATEVGGIPEILTPQLALFVSPGDVDALSNALDEAPTTLAHRPEVAVLARDRFDANFEATAWARRLGDLYDEVTAAPAARTPGTPG
jgi:glycosyltransferase involved in cell wall biosynthesis